MSDKNDGWALWNADTVDCGNCGHPVKEWPMAGRWVHWVNGTKSSVGCRSASFDRLDGEGWDDSIPRTWQARPPRKVGPASRS